MKRLLIGLFVTAAMTVAAATEAPALSVSDYPAGLAAMGIANSRHNLGSLGRSITTDATTEICVFCHTPHQSAVGSGALWNKGVQATPYASYGTTSRGTVVGAPGGSTLACLSCHDGVNTFDTLINAPGKGNAGFNNTNVTDMGWSFKMPGSAPSPGNDHFDDTGSCSSCHVSLGDGTDPGARLSVGTDLTNDHPVSVYYDSLSAGSDLRPASTVINSIDLTAELIGSATSMYGGNLSQNRWAVKGEISDTATISDLLRGGKVECSSCHDPHFKNLSWDEAESTWAGGWGWCADAEDCSDGSFLRRVGGNTGSGICRTCHTR